MTTLSEFCYRCFTIVHKDQLSTHSCNTANADMKGDQSMATRNNTPVNTVNADDEDEFNIPDEVDIPEHSNDVIVPQQGALSLQDLDNIGFNDARDEQERAKLNPPTGDWEKEDQWKADIRCQQGNCMPGDLDPTGRTSLNFMGKPKPRQANGMEYEPMLFIRLSPDIRYKEDDPSKTDMAYKLFLKAKDLYMELYKEKPRNLKQLMTMLREDAYIVRTMNGDNGPIVVDIKAKRTRGARS